MAQLMPLPLTVSCFSKIQIGLPFWYRLTHVVMVKGPLNGCVCVCVCVTIQCPRYLGDSCISAWNSGPLHTVGRLDSAHPVHRIATPLRRTEPATSISRQCRAASTEITGRDRHPSYTARGVTSLPGGSRDPAAQHGGCRRRSGRGASLDGAVLPPCGRRRH